MELYIKLLRIFLNAGIIFGVTLGLILAVSTSWTAGLIYGVVAGLSFWLGVSGILLILSVLKSRPRRG